MGKKTTMNFNSDTLSSGIASMVNPVTGAVDMDVIRTRDRYYYVDKTTLIYDEETGHLRVGQGSKMEAESVSGIKTVPTYEKLPINGKVDTLYFCLDSGNAFVWNPDTDSWVPILYDIQDKVLLKADKSYVDTKLALKADNTAVNNKLKLKADITYVDTQIKPKADKSYVDSVVAQKADKSYVDDELSKKVDKTYINTKLDEKATITYVDNKVDPKADKTYVDNGLAKKADKTYVDTELGKKADKTYVDNGMSLKMDITTAEAALAKKVNKEYVDIQMNNKADKTYVDNKLKAKANTADMEEKLSTKADKVFVNDSLAKKADKTYTDERLNTKADKKYVDDNFIKKSEIATIDGSLKDKADKTYVDTELAKKADKTYVNAELDKKATTAYVDNNLKQKMDKAVAETAIAKKADKTYVDDALAKKADKSYVDDKLKDFEGAVDIDGKLSKKADKTYVDTNLASKTDKTYVDTNLAKKADKTYAETKASEALKESKSYTDEKILPKSEVAGIAVSPGQVVRVGASGGFTAGDMLKVVRAAGSPAEISQVASQPINMAEVFSNWNRISCDTNGENQNSGSAEQVKTRNAYYYDSAEETIVNTYNSTAFGGFLSGDTYSPDYKIKYKLIGRSGDDDGLFFICGFMTDEDGKFHTLSVLRTGDSETKSVDPITTMEESSHGVRFAICYDIYNAWAKKSKAGKILEYTVEPLKVGWSSENSSLCEVQKSSTQIVAKTADTKSDDMKYVLTFTLPESKPADWTDEQYKNIKYMMENPTKIGFGTQSNECSFKVLEQTGSVTAVSIYDVTSCKKLTYKDGKKVSEEADTSVITAGCFLYCAITKRLFYVKDKSNVVPIVLDGSASLSEPTKNVAIIKSFDETTGALELVSS